MEPVNGITMDVVGEIRIPVNDLRHMHIEDGVVVISIIPPAKPAPEPAEDLVRDPASVARVKATRRPRKPKTEAKSKVRQKRRSCGRCVSRINGNCTNRSSPRAGQAVKGQMCCDEFCPAEKPTTVGTCSVCLWRGLAPDHKCGNHESHMLGKCTPGAGHCDGYTVQE